MTARVIIEAQQPDGTWVQKHSREIKDSTVEYVQQFLDVLPCIDPINFAGALDIMCQARGFTLKEAQYLLVMGEWDPAIEDLHEPTELFQLSQDAFKFLLTLLKSMRKWRGDEVKRRSKSGPWRWE